MSRPAKRHDNRWIHAVLVLVVATATATTATGCDDLDGRGQNRKGNRYYREGKFIDAAAHYERALAKVQDDKIQYNIGLAYSKIFKPGLESAVLLAEAGSDVCAAIPNNTPVKKRVCVKNDPNEEDRTYVPCGDSKEAICPSSATCKELDFCSIANEKLVDLASEHLSKWVEKQPPDEELRKSSDELGKEIEKMDVDIQAAEADIEKYTDPQTGKALDKGAWNDATQRRASLEEKIKVKREERDEFELKFRIRELITQMFLDSQKYDKAIAYWQKLLDSKPNDLEAMGNLAGINLKAGDWKKSIEWYSKVAEVSPDNQGKLTALGFIGNVAWSKLNSKTLSQDEAIELADLGLGALQKAHEMAPKNLRFLGTAASIYNFRGLTHGASFAAAIDRASSQDLKGLIDVVSGKAKPTEKPSTPPAGTPDPKDPKKPSTPTPGSGSGKKTNG